MARLRSEESRANYKVNGSGGDLAQAIRVLLRAVLWVALLGADFTQCLSWEQQQGYNDSTLRWYVWVRAKHTKETGTSLILGGFSRLVTS